MLEGLLWVVLGLVAVALVALTVPVDVKARLDIGARTHGTLRIGWLFGLVRLEREFGAQEPTSPKKPKDRSPKRAARRPGVAVVRRGLGLLGDLLRRVRVRHMELDLAVGTEDPASTGELVGFAAPLVALANALPQTRVTLRPNFAGPTFEGVGAGEICLVPIAWVPPVFGFALSPEVRTWLFAQR